MADKKISQLTSATTPLAGTEVVPIVQGGSTVKVAVSDLTAGRTVEATTFDATNVEVTNIKAKDGSASMSIADSTGNVNVSTNLGVGIAPSAKLHVAHETSGTNDIVEVARIQRNTTGTAAVGLGAALNFQMERSDGALDFASRICAVWSNASASVAAGYLRFDITINGDFFEAMRIDANKNILLNGTQTPSSASGAIALFNGTAPSASVTDGVVLFAEDVASSSELKVRDEAGNTTTLSPHNFSLIPEGPSEDMAWSYFSERDGKRINIDMLKAIRLIERLSGEKLVHES